MLNIRRLSRLRKGQRQQSCLSEDFFSPPPAPGRLRPGLGRPAPAPAPSALPAPMDLRHRLTPAAWAAAPGNSPLSACRSPKGRRPSQWRACQAASLLEHRQLARGVKWTMGPDPAYAQYPPGLTHPARGRRSSAARLTPQRQRLGLRRPISARQGSPCRGDGNRALLPRKAKAPQRCGEDPRPARRMIWTQNAKLAMSGA